MLPTANMLISDPLFTAITTCSADPRPNKLDLLAGVYRNELLQTPVMKAVRLAQSRVAQQELTKNYLSLSGRESFIAAILDLVVGTGELRRRALGVQAVGGSGALKLLCELVKRANPRATLWLSNPGYCGHRAIGLGTGLPIRHYIFLHDDKGSVTIDHLLDSLGTAAPGDAVVFDSACHNPTGTDLSADQWPEVGKFCERKGLTPIVDVAYQGLGTDLECDVSSIAVLSRCVEYMMIAVSCSKTFGIYRERAGAALLIGPSCASVAGATQALTEIGFSVWAVPPDHGAAIVETILSDASLRSLWRNELCAMRTRVMKLRADLADALSAATAAEPLEYIGRGRGMFALLPLSSRQMQELRDEFAIHGLPNGRVNVTCLEKPRIETMCNAIRIVLRHKV